MCDMSGNNRSVRRIYSPQYQRAQKTLWQAARIVAEPGDAAAFSALLSGAYRPTAGERVGVVISGGNSAAVDFER